MLNYKNGKVSKYKSINPLLSGLLLSLISVSVQAFNPIQNITVNGFVTGGLATTNARNITFVDPLFHQTLREVPLYLTLIDQEPTAEADTLGGIQFNMGLFDPNASIVLQFVAQGANNFNVEATWAYFDYKFSDMFSVRVGRVLMPLLMYSDYQFVRYAYPWLRLPQEVYNLSGTQQNNGILLDFKVPVFRSWLLEIVEVPVSTVISDIAQNFVNFGRIYGATDIRLSNDSTVLRVGYLHGKGRFIDTPQSITLPQSFIGAPCITLATFFDVRDAGTPLGGQCDIYLTSSPGALLLSAGVVGAPQVADAMTAQLSSDVFTAGYDINWNHFRAIGEYIYTQVGTKSLLAPATQSWYTSLGYRERDVLVMLTYAQARIRNNNARNIDTPLLDWVNPFYIDLPGNLSPTGLPIGTSMQTSLNNFFGLFEKEQNSYSIDVRWDVIDSVALKGEVQWIDPKGALGVGLYNIPPDKITAVYSISVDAIF